MRHIFTYTIITFLSSSFLDALSYVHKKDTHTHTHPQIDTRYHGASSKLLVDICMRTPSPTPPDHIQVEKSTWWRGRPHGVTQWQHTLSTRPTNSLIMAASRRKTSWPGKKKWTQVLDIKVIAAAKKKNHHLRKAPELNILTLLERLMSGLIRVLYKAGGVTGIVFSSEFV